MSSKTLILYLVAGGGEVYLLLLPWEETDEQGFLFVCGSGCVGLSGYEVRAVCGVCMWPLCEHLGLCLGYVCMHGTAWGRRTCMHRAVCQVCVCCVFACVKQCVVCTHARACVWSTCACIGLHLAICVHEAGL